MTGSCGRSRAISIAGRDGAGLGRREALSRGVAGATAIAGFLLLGPRPRAAGAAPSGAQDQKIFNYALLLEYLQAAFYSESVDQDRLKGEVRDFAKIVSEHERDHVKYLQKALGSAARARPRFNFGNATRDQKKFLDAAVLLENTGVAAYNGQAANLTKKALAAAAEIVSVEGRHAAWISDLAGKDPAPRAADPGATTDEVIATLRGTGFLRAT